MTQQGCKLSPEAQDPFAPVAVGGSKLNPRQRPRIELFDAGECTVLFEEDHMTAAAGTAEVDVKAAAAWTRRALKGEVALPLPIVNQARVLPLRHALRCRFQPGQSHRGARDLQRGGRVMSPWAALQNR